MVKRANPGSWITLESIRLAREGLPELAFRRFVANQWTERARDWLPPGAWQQCVTSPAVEAGETVAVGVDVGGQRSATAVAWVTDDLRAGVEITARRADRRDGRTGGSGFRRHPGVTRTLASLDRAQLHGRGRAHAHEARASPSARTGDTLRDPGPSPAILAAHGEHTGNIRAHSVA